MKYFNADFRISTSDGFQFEVVGGHLAYGRAREFRDDNISAVINDVLTAFWTDLRKDGHVLVFPEPVSPEGRENPLYVESDNYLSVPLPMVTYASAVLSEISKDEFNEYNGTA